MARVAGGAAVTFGQRDSFIGDAHSDTTNFVTAHEIGHLLGLSDDPDDTALMFGQAQQNHPNRCFVNQRSWRGANP